MLSKRKDERENTPSQAAPYELKLVDGEQSDESGLSARWRRQECSSGVICENHVVGSEFLSESGHTHTRTHTFRISAGKPLETKLLKELKCIPGV